MTLHGVVKLCMARSKPVAGSLLLLAVAAAVVAGIAEWQHRSVADTALLRLIPAVAEAVAGLGWAAVGGVLAWLRPGNVLGWIMLGVGTLAQVGLAEESVANAGWYGVLDPNAPWQGRAGGLVLSIVTGLAIYVMIGLLPVLYPSGRWPGRAWLLPAAAVIAGAILLQIQWTAGVLASAALSVPGPAGIASLDGPPAWMVLVPGATFALGVLAVWAMCVVRLVRARAPERAQLLWLLVTVAALLATQLAGGSIPGRWLLALCCTCSPPRSP
ncbi:hypothetical protein ART_0071 [Arthrobacter sp. PAMC 25486]|uniref:hypothetical protein n=1 Tax=Arthrobacter sp. PAMC 25486 TaxID=1494608 RepID=UPI000535F454|nr:hypothetical protein [Arthrobacter sp. PAMC 25486]AIX99669.1 hypothetical protein ART_0071 [Arthrobacter sp. PAMC 25486]